MKDSKVSVTKVMSGLFWVYCENIIAQIVSFVVSIILARLLEPSYYGTIALVNVFIGVANVFVTSSFSYALIQKKDADDLDYNTMFWFNLVLSWGLYIVLFLIAPMVSNFYGNHDLTVILRVLAIRIPLSAYNTIQLAYVANHMTFKKSFVSTTGGAIVSAIVGIILAYTGFGIWALVAQNITNILFNTIFLLFVVKWKPKMVYSNERLKPMITYGWKLLATGLMFTGYSELRTLVIGKRYTTDDLGYYDRGYSFPRLIASNIDSTITRVLFPTLSHNQDDKTRLTEMTQRAAKTSAYIMTPILFGLAIVAEPLVKFLLTEKWLPCVPYIQVMSLVWWLQPTQSCSIQAIKAIGRSDVYLLIEIINKAIGILLLIGSVAWFDSVYAIAISMLIGQIVAVVVYGVFVSKNINYRLWDQIKDLLIPAILGAVMCLALHSISLSITHELVCLIVEVAAGALIYVALSVVLKIEPFLYLIGLFRNKYKIRFK